MAINILFTSAHAEEASSAKVLEADEPARWEYGVGLGVIELPSYRGSGKKVIYALPFPYLGYQSKHLSIGLNGARTSLIRKPIWEVNLSLGGSLPVKASDNDARHGMPSLKPSVEIGPALIVRPWKSRDELWDTKITVPVRGALTVQNNPKWIGFLLTPAMDLRRREFAHIAHLNTNFRINALFTDRRNSAYFYQVDQEYVTAERPAYGARGGYAGFQLSLSTNYRWRDFYFGLYLKRDDLHNATFDDSPLVRKKVDYTVGGLVVWTFGRSGRRLDDDDD